MDEWSDISAAPREAIQVEFYCGNAPAGHVLKPYRDERRSLGYWDGSDWRFCGTGHRVFERDDVPEYLPTHWRSLPPPPATLTSQKPTGESK